MSRAQGLPDPALAQFVLEECGPVARWTNASWDHGESDVWRATLISGRSVYVKRHRQPAKFAQERAAYERWAPAVGQCPRLHAARGGDLRVILLEEAPGTPLLGTDIAPDVEAQHYAEAGGWLRRLHGLPWDDTDGVNVASALARRSAAWSERARALGASPLTEETIATVHAEVSAPWPEGTAVPSRVPCHRDFTARNWIVCGAALQVIDFEHARADWSFTDLERVKSSIPPDRRKLWQAFKSGYGLTLDEAEESLLRRLQLHAALGRVVWAVEHDDAAFQAEGLGQLERLLDAP